MSSSGAFRQYTLKYDLTSGPVRFKKFTMLSDTEQLFIAKISGDQKPAAKQSMSGGYIVDTGSWSLDAMAGGGSWSGEENEGDRYLSTGRAIVSCEPVPGDLCVLIL